MSCRPRARSSRKPRAMLWEYPTTLPMPARRFSGSIAPVWEVRAEAEYDRIGTPAWTSKDELDIDTRQPRTYTLLSFTRFGKEILTQLNYIIWFPSRPRENALDIYGGLLDGLNYRVTLDKNGEPLLYETIHNCGCYYEAYPTRRLKVREKIDYAEPPLILKAPEVTLQRSS